jgi:hypothetical protein
MKSLSDLRNVGKATLKDLDILNIRSIEELAKQDPTSLFQEIKRKTKKRHDPCMWDVFAAIIYEAKTGEKTPWWYWTKKRKKLQEKGIVKHLL